MNSQIASFYQYIYRLSHFDLKTSVTIVSNEYQEMPGANDSVNTNQQIVFQINVDEPDIFSIGILFTLSLMSFTFMAIELAPKK